MIESVMIGIFGLIWKFDSISNQGRGLHISLSILFEVSYSVLIYFLKKVMHSMAYIFSYGNFTFNTCFLHVCP